MGFKYKLELNHTSIQGLIGQLKKYEDSLDYKVQLILEKLADKGISVASQNTSGEYRPYIQFKKVAYVGLNGDKAILVMMYNTDRPIKEWRHSGEPSGYKQAEVNPVLMVEYGSGLYATDVNEIDRYVGGGQGQFPGQKHAFDPNGWTWTTPDGVQHHSYGDIPQAPLMHAMNEMYSEVLSVVKEVFANG